MDGQIYVYVTRNHLLRLPGNVRMQVTKGARYIDKDVYEVYKNTGLFKPTKDPEADAVDGDENAPETPSDASDDAQDDPGMDDAGESKEDDSEGSDEDADAGQDDESENAEESLIDIINAFTKKDELEDFAETNLDTKVDKRKSLKNMKASLIEKLELE